MTLDLVDTHCHLDWESLQEDFEAVLGRARSAGVRQCVTIGTDVASSERNVALAAKHDMLFAAVGIHPHEADSADASVEQAIADLSKADRVVAIGEVGLDQYRNNATPKNQERVLRYSIDLALGRDLPIIIHCRDAYEPLLAILSEYKGKSLRGVIHCASGPSDFIKGALTMGFYISFAGNVTFPKAGALRELVALVPEEKLLIETDSPFLAPQVVRGKRNEPSFVAYTAEFIAQLREVPVEALAARTSSNARNLFHLPTP